MVGVLCNKFQNSRRNPKLAKWSLMEDYEVKLEKIIQGSTQLCDPHVLSYVKVPLCFSKLRPPTLPTIYSWMQKLFAELKNSAINLSILDCISSSIASP